MRELRAEFPPEPPEGSIVLDWESFAWQRHRHDWHRVGRGGHPYSWRSLLMSGAVRVIYEPETL